jgi:tripartite ATP-independent transporter DctP family solute receptor
MNHTRILSVLASLAMSIGTVSPSFAADAKKFRGGAILSPDDPMTLHLADWAKRIKQKTNGEVNITVFDSGKLGGERETVEQMQVGALDCAVVSNAVLTNFAPTNGVYNLPYVFVNAKQCLAFDQTAEAKLLRDRFEKESGLKMIGFFPEGFRHVMNTKKPIQAPSDLKGLKIRVMENPIHVASINAMGAAATPISWNEVLTSIQTGVVNGFENSIPTLTSVKSWELMKNMAMTSHFYDVSFVVMAKKSWEVLSPVQQKAVMEAQTEALQQSLGVLDRANKDWRP